LATVDFVFNNKIHTATKLSPFKVNYRRELRIGFKIRKKGKYTKAEEFVKKMKEMHEKAKAVLKKYADGNRKEIVEYKIEDKVLLSTKDLMW